MIIPSRVLMLVLVAMRRFTCKVWMTFFHWFWNLQEGAGP